MANPNITVMSSTLVNTFYAPGVVRKRVILYGIRDATYLNDVLTEYPLTPSGSQAQDLSTGSIYTLLDGDWIKMG